MDEKGFFARLFDMSFTEFVIIRLIPILYGLAIALAGISTIAFIVMGFATGGATGGILALVLSPIIFLLHVLGARVYCEIIIAVFRIAENTRRMADQLAPRAPSAGGVAPQP